MATDPTHEEIVRTLAAASIGEFVHVMRLVLEARAADLDQKYFTSRYALATITASTAGPLPEISLVAYPNEPPMRDGLWESGTCRRCGYVAVSTNKISECGACGAVVSLT